MREQRLLFDVVPARFAERIWTRIPSEKRKEVMAILAEMARRGLCRSGESGKEMGDEK